jgi:hypothetical protein
LWRWRNRGGGDWCGFFDCLLDNRRFFDFDWLGNNHNRGYFLDDNGRRWFDFDDWW